MSASGFGWRDGFESSATGEGMMAACATGYVPLAMASCLCAFPLRRYGFASSPDLSHRLEPVPCSGESQAASPATPLLRGGSFFIGRPSGAPRADLRTPTGHLQD